ncbi:hypothetical protein GCM10023189_48740 [Nibrella saemangeumensis]|uniref:Uncharacterized protein n=2 Tax=Nibrella saemangeumensis TaxID=1084526 RepID=A0ABP8NJM5_9BACT
MQFSCDSPADQQAATVQEKPQDATTEGRAAEKSVRIKPRPKTTPGSETQEQAPEVAQNDQEGPVESTDQPFEESQEDATSWDSEREELRKNVKAEIDAIETKIDELKGEIDGAGPDVRTRCQRAISELRYERAKLSTQLKSISSARRDNWEKVKVRISNAIHATDERISQVSEQVAR